MEQKTWLWRRKSSEKNVLEKSDLLAKEQEKERALKLERSVQDLNEQLSSARTESDAKDDLLAKQAKVAEEAITGWERAETEALSFKQILDDALQQKEVMEEKIDKLDVALKDCHQQLNVSKEEKEHIINEAAKKISKEQEKLRTLEQKLAETNKKIASLGDENSNLCTIVEMKERLIEELNESKALVEANLAEVSKRLDLTEKGNASLKYEVCMLQKELEIRTEERGYNIKSADAAHKQQLESVKKIAKLEAECQRLRVMVRKRLPGPAALAKMRSEVELLGHDNYMELRSKSANSPKSFASRGFVSENGYEAASLLERLRASEDENKILRESLTKKTSEIEHTSSRLSQIERQLKDLSKGHDCYDHIKSSPRMYEHPLASISEGGGHGDNVSCAESWASALISELEHFRNGKPTTPSSRSIGMSDLSLMDDFVEMEKLAVTYVDNRTLLSAQLPSRDSRSCVTTTARSDFTEEAGKELIPVENLSGYITLENYPSWLQDILRVIIQKHHITQKSIDAIFEDVRSALQKQDLFIRGNSSNALNANGNTPRKPQSASLDSFEGIVDTSASHTETANQLSKSNIEKVVSKLIEQVEGIIRRCKKNNDGQLTVSGSDTVSPKSGALNGYVARAFLWETSELTTVLRHFILVCNNLLYGKADPERFISEVSSTLDWIINHCFSLQDVSDMRESIIKHFGGDENCINEFRAVPNSPSLGKNKLDDHDEIKIKGDKIMPLFYTPNGLCSLFEMDIIESRVKESATNRAIPNIELRRSYCEEKIENGNSGNEAPITQVPESEQRTSNFRAEPEAVKESKLIDENHKLEYTAVKVELNETRKRFSSLKVEVENEISTSESEAVAASKGSPKHIIGQEENQLRTSSEIALASEKLAECQETILNLGKQLKALASPKDAALLEKVMLSPTTARPNRRLQLLDHMLAEDGANFEDPNFPQTKEIICTEPRNQQDSTAENPKPGSLNGRNVHTDDNRVSNGSVQATTHPVIANKHTHEGDVEMLALVPKTQRGGTSLLRKLLLRKKESKNTKKLTLPISSFEGKELKGV
ncbi:Filament-like plant protein 7 [Ananas comosus]|uniref:Filament-like plant protein 7 n=1 Tax=Ananas comosus TaxID=4615 RepID=A0A199W6Q8_ANACO|nr:Filament-like plant protein 7 [Ananas comosus]